MKEFSKSVKGWWSYRKKFDNRFFSETQCSEDLSYNDKAVMKLNTGGLAAFLCQYVRDCSVPLESWNLIAPCLVTECKFSRMISHHHYHHHHLYFRQVGHSIAYVQYGQTDKSMVKHYITHKNSTHSTIKQTYFTVALVMSGHRGYPRHCW